MEEQVRPLHHVVDLEYPRELWFTFSGLGGTSPRIVVSCWLLLLVDDVGWCCWSMAVVVIMQQFLCWLCAWWANKNSFVLSQHNALHQQRKMRRDNEREVLPLWILCLGFVPVLHSEARRVPLLFQFSWSEPEESQKWIYSLHSSSGSLPSNASLPIQVLFFEVNQK